MEELLKLTPTQKKAWKKFEEAVDECISTGIIFRNWFGIIYAINGTNVEYFGYGGWKEKPSIYLDFGKYPSKSSENFRQLPKEENMYVKLKEK